MARPTDSHARVIAYVALFAAIATGGATAANTIRTEDIVDASVTNVDLAEASVSNGKLDLLRFAQFTGTRTVTGSGVTGGPSVTIQQARPGLAAVFAKASIRAFVDEGSTPPPLGGNVGVRITRDGGPLTSRRLMQRQAFESPGFQTRYTGASPFRETGTGTNEAPTWVVFDVPAGSLTFQLELEKGPSITRADYRDIKLWVWTQSLPPIPSLAPTQGGTGIVTPQPGAPGSPPPPPGAAPSTRR